MKYTAEKMSWKQNKSHFPSRWRGGEEARAWGLGQEAWARGPVKALTCLLYKLFLIPHRLRESPFKGTKGLLCEIRSMLGGGGWLCKLQAGLGKCFSLCRFSLHNQQMFILSLLSSHPPVFTGHVHKSKIIWIEQVNWVGSVPTLDNFGKHGMLKTSPDHPAVSFPYLQQSYWTEDLRLREIQSSPCIILQQREEAKPWREINFWVTHMLKKQWYFSSFDNDHFLKRETLINEF